MLYPYKCHSVSLEPLVY